jgi:hypothetical protein
VANKSNEHGVYLQGMETWEYGAPPLLIGEDSLFLGLKSTSQRQWARVMEETTGQKPAFKALNLA